MPLTPHTATTRFTAACAGSRGTLKCLPCFAKRRCGMVWQHEQLSFTSLTTSAVTCSWRANHTVARSPPAFGAEKTEKTKQVGETKEGMVVGPREAEQEEPVQDVCVLGKLDMFAKSRMLNYISRHTAGASSFIEGSGSSETNRSKSSPFSVIETPDKTLYRAELLLPVSSHFLGAMKHTELVAVGYADQEKDAIVAACMHGERCLDAMGIPLFTSDRLQRKRVEEAKREGRYAPMPGDAVREVSLDDLPFPILYKRNDSDAAHNGRSSGVLCGRGTNASSYPVLQSYQPHYGSAKRRYNDFSRRYGNDPFLRGVAGELAYLHARIFQHNTQAPGMEDGDEENTPFVIDPLEVEILQPSRAETDARTIPEAGQLSHCPAMRLALVNSRPVNEHRITGFIDESEGGIFDLVEGEKGTWWVHEKLPGMSCLFDPYAMQRIDWLYQTHYQVGFEACVETVAQEEMTQVDIGFGPHCRKKLKWYTATAPIPDHTVLRATGKATSFEHALLLCAMHAELILSFLGVCVSPKVVDQTRYYDACLRYGRFMSPAPRELGDDVRTLLPKPLKQWLRIKKSRKRGAPMNLSEKLMALNRRVVADLRQHLVEVDICSEPHYRELLTLSMSTLRQFMVEQRHPYEAAYINYVYSENNQYRCSIYLPLPETYGVRGGNAIGSTPERARELCALHAVDTLCALNIPVTRNKEKLDHLMEVRKQFGLILPRDPGGGAASSTATCNIRSPPGYRDAPGHATKQIPPHQDVWNLMMADAGEFDVVKEVDPNKCHTLGLPDTYTLLRSLFQAYLKTVGWNATDQWSHMKHYQGSQRWGDRLRVPCNNYWMDLPVNESIYGRRVALGRCVFRKGAEKAFYIHAFRILHALQLAPWDVYNDAIHQRFFHGTPLSQIERDMRWWKFVVEEFVTPEMEVPAGVDGESTVVQEAEVVISSSADLRKVLSPNPVMTHELAKRTFV